MSLSEADIERIVQEVLRRLAAMTPAPPAVEPTLSIAARVVTLAEVNGKLQGIKRVEVPRRAVVTPAARDYLRERGVKICELAK